MKDIIIPFEIVKGADPVLISPMQSKDEKLLLEYAIMTDDSNQIFDAACRILGVPGYLPYDLKVAVLYKIREISFGGDLSLRFKCNQCFQLSESSIMMDNLLRFPLKEKFDTNLKLSETNLEPLLSFNISNAYKFFEGVKTPTTVLEASVYASALRAKIPTMTKSINTNCIFCGHKKEVSIVNKKFILNSLSEQTLLTMIKMYNALASNGFSKMDVDSMLPFEREVHAKLFMERTAAMTSKSNSNQIQ